MYQMKLIFIGQRYEIFSYYRIFATEIKGLSYLHFLLFSHRLILALTIYRLLVELLNSDSWGTAPKLARNSGKIFLAEICEIWRDYRSD